MSLFIVLEVTSDTQPCLFLLQAVVNEATVGLNELIKKEGRTHDKHKKWRTQDAYMKDEQKESFEPGAINLVSAWFEQGNDVSASS